MKIDQLQEQALNKKYAQAIVNYLIKRIETDQCLKEKIETTEKTLLGCINYCKQEAEKQAEDHCAIIPDDEVFEWVVHYFLEDEIKENKKIKLNNTSITNHNEEPITAKPIVKKTKEAKQALYEQLSLFE